MYKVSQPYVLLSATYRLLCCKRCFIYSLRLFIVGGEHIAMTMVVVGHICTQNIMVVHNIIHY